MKVPPRTAIVFVHGIASGFADWKPVVQYHFKNYSTMRYNLTGKLTYQFNEQAPAVWVVSYYSQNVLAETVTGDLTQYTERLLQILEQITALSGAEQYILMAHSMGGLVARSVMVQSQEHWDSVRRIVTVATPHLGVKVSIGIVGQLRDLRYNSDFIQQLNTKWDLYAARDGNPKWGVIGAYHPMMAMPMMLTSGSANDLGGPGWVALYSAIPYGEWKDALQEENIISYESSHFGFRVVVQAQHKKLLKHSIVKKALAWALL